MTIQMIDPFSITVLRDQPALAVAHNLTRSVGVQVLADGVLGVETGEWTAYKNNGGQPLIEDRDVVFTYPNDEA